MACATDVGGGSPGAGGSGQTGTAGTTGTGGAIGTAGVAGTAGASGKGGSTSTPGTAGMAGAAGGGTAGAGGTSAGAAGTSGTAGTTGTGGRGGTSGTAGTAGRGGSGAGTSGTTGTAGSVGPGTAGTTGTGTAGATGQGGSGGAGAGPVNLNGRKALLVVDNPSSLDAGEVIVQMTLQNRGMIVTIGASTGPASIASGQDLVLVSSSAGSGDFAPVFKDVAVPMIVLGNAAYNNLGWLPTSSSKGTVDSSTLCSLVDGTTPLASDVMTGVGFKMILPAKSTSLYWGTPGGSPIRTASVMGQATQLVSFAYEKGAAMATGTAAARRVGFGVKIDYVQYLTIEGFKLFMAAVEWAGGP